MKDTMKFKLRKITINYLVYLYAVTDIDHPETQTNTLTVKVYLNGEKKTPLFIDFLTKGAILLFRPGFYEKSFAFRH
jgi:hypothetical protein